MALRGSIGFLIVAAAAAVPGVSNAARADEAYVCGPDKLVYVKADELEMKKRTDPCIASYYGLTVEAPAKPQSNPAAAKSAGPDTAPAVNFKKSVVSDNAERRAVEQVVRQASLQPAAASAGTDYRNVRVINASSADAAWFYHAR